jgi:hypothetical protein
MQKSRARKLDFGPAFIFQTSDLISGFTPKQPRLLPLRKSAN